MANRTEITAAPGKQEIFITREFTFEFEGLPERGHVTLETAKFETLPGDRTKLTNQSVFQSVEDRDGMLQSGMEAGVTEGYDRLDELLERVKR